MLVKLSIDALIVVILGNLRGDGGGEECEYEPQPATISQQYQIMKNVIRNKYLCQMFSSDRQLEIAKSIYNLCRNLCQSENHTYHEFLELQRLANSLSPTK